VINASHSKKSSSFIGPAVNIGSDEEEAALDESVVRSLYSFISLKFPRTYWVFSATERLDTWMDEIKLTVSPP
jgi:hypothetical protein